MTTEQAETFVWFAARSYLIECIRQGVSPIKGQHLLEPTLKDAVKMLIVIKAAMLAYDL